MTLQLQTEASVLEGTRERSALRTNFEAAREAGQRDATSYGATLALREAAERQDRLTRLVLQGTPAGRREAMTQLPIEDWERLVNFHRALLNSRSWVWLQRLRRVVGREW